MSFFHILLNNVKCEKPSASHIAFVPIYIVNFVRTDGMRESHFFSFWQIKSADEIDEQKMWSKKNGKQNRLWKRNDLIDTHMNVSQPCSNFISHNVTFNFSIVYANFAIIYFVFYSM